MFNPAARLVRAHLSFANHWVKHNDFCWLGMTYVTLALCFKLRSYFTLISTSTDPQ